jgi:hypothetical protein
MARAGYDPLGMALLRYVAQRTGTSRVNAGTFDRSPDFSDRVAEAKNRADQIGRLPRFSGLLLMRERRLTRRQSAGRA